VLRTVLLYAVPALLVATGWLRLEEGRGAGDTAFLVVLLAVVPALVRPRWGRALAAALVSLLAIRAALGLPASDARPFDDRHDYVGPLLGTVKDGVLRFWDVSLPFSPAQEPDMHGVVLLAIFAFCLAVGLGLAARRPLAAALALVAGAAWPATLVAGPGGFARGVLILGAALSILAWGRREAPYSLRPAIVAGAVLALATIGATSSPAVAKGAFLSWKGWDPYDEPDRQVGVRYVWDAHYSGIKFPEKVTTVLTVKSVPRALYWRATTLDLFENDRWVEELRPIGSSSRPLELPHDPLVPQVAFNRRRWIRADVKVEALRDKHLAGPSMPVAYDPRDAGTVHYDAGGVATLEDGLRRGLRYTVWAYAPRPTPVQLARSRPPRSLRNTVHSRYLELTPGVSVLPFGAEDRDEQLRNILENPLYGPDVQPYEPLFQTARELAAQADTPYGAVFTVEAWFRSQGGFEYDEQPGLSLSEPPLVSFLRTRAGYCQHFAGAMTLMLRSLGIPARVAVGFTSGAYDARKLEWKVTDHDAHAWVEVWFDGYGWIPFDPTPGRGRLSGPYSSASPTLDRNGLVSAFVGGLSPVVRGELQRSRARGTQIGPSRDVPGDLPGAVGAVRDTGASLLRLLVLLAAAALGAIVLAKLVVRRTRYLTRDPRRIAAACRAELVDFLADQGVRVSHSSTFAELGDTVSERLAVDADDFVAAAGAARFAPPEEAPAAARRARHELRLLRRRMRRRLSASERARGLVSVRSLGLTG
jgi:transglutaminase-like putative cysteine protease